MPTRANMLMSLRWLTEGAAAGDEMFFHYSGHGGQMEDRRGDEPDGKNETLVPCDFQRNGQITDEDLYSNLVACLPRGCRLWVVLDCYDSGSALNLRYKIQLSADGRSAKVTKKEKQRIASPEATKAEVVMISGCRDSHTSATIGAGFPGAEQAAGAMTTAFRSSITPDISCHKLLQQMRRFLKRNNSTQVPQMSSEQYLQLDSCYVDYNARSKTRLKAGAAPPFASPSVAAVQPSPDPDEPLARQPVQTVDSEQYLASVRINRLEEEIQRLRYGHPS